MFRDKQLIPLCLKIGKHGTKFFQEVYTAIVEMRRLILQQPVSGE
jgi:hypothetical protein